MARKMSDEEVLQRMLENTLRHNAGAYLLHMAEEYRGQSGDMKPVLTVAAHYADSLGHTYHRDTSERLGLFFDAVPGETVELKGNKGKIQL